MNIKEIKLALSIIVSAAVPVGGFAQAEVTPPAMPEQNQAAQEKLKHIENEYREVAAKLSSIEEEALEQGEVLSAKNHLETLVTDGIVEADPKLKGDLEKRSQYSEYVQKAQAGEPLPDGMDVNKVYSEYNALHQRILPVEQQVMQKSEVQTALTDYRETLIAQMQELDPNAMEYISKQQSLRNEYQETLKSIQGQQNR